MNAQIIHTPTGDEMVILTRADYDALIASAAPDDADEDDLAAALIAATNGEEAFPESVWEAIEAGQQPLEAFRKHRGMTQAQLADASGVSQGFISDVEKNGKLPSLNTLAKLGRALKVPSANLIPTVR